MKRNPRKRGGEIKMWDDDYSKWNKLADQVELEESDDGNSDSSDDEDVDDDE